LTIEDLETLLADKYAKLDVVPLDESLEELEENSVQLDFAKDDE
jgi:hypothetical protein